MSHIQTEATRKKLSMIHKGKKLSEITKKKLSIARMGIKLSEETKRKISEAMKGNKNPNYGIKITNERKKILSETTRRLKAGVRLTEEHKKKLSEAHRGDKCNFWKGGISAISKYSYNVNWTMTLKRSIRERDKYLCQFCGEPQMDKAHDVHHIDYNRDNCNPNNLITLCHKCHMKTNTNRKYWKNIIKKHMQIKYNNMQGALI